MPGVISALQRAQSTDCHLKKEPFGSPFPKQMWTVFSQGSQCNDVLGISLPHQTDAPRNSPCAKPDLPTGSCRFPGRNLAWPALGSSFINSQILLWLCQLWDRHLGHLPSMKTGSALLVENCSLQKISAATRGVEKWELDGGFPFQKRLSGECFSGKTICSSFISSSCHSGVPEKGAVQLAQWTTLAAMMWDFRNVRIAAVHLRTKSDTEKEEGWLIGLRWHLERIINQHKVNFTTGITAFLSSGSFVTLDNRTYSWQCQLLVLLYLEITPVNFLFPEHKLHVSSFSVHYFPSPFVP